MEETRAGERQVPEYPPQFDPIQLNRNWISAILSGLGRFMGNFSFYYYYYYLVGDIYRCKMPKNIFN